MHCTNPDKNTRTKQLQAARAAKPSLAKPATASLEASAAQWSAAEKRGNLHLNGNRIGFLVLGCMPDCIHTSVTSSLQLSLAEFEDELSHNNPLQRCC